MRSYQREPVLVVLDRIGRYLPALYRVTALAVCPELAAVNVGVAVSALRTHTLEHQARMTLGASHLFMHPAQRITGLIVIELRVGTNRLPAGITVTILARNRDRSVRIGHLGLRSIIGRHRSSDTCLCRRSGSLGRGLQRHATKHGCQPQGCRNEPAYALHLSLRAVRSSESPANTRQPISRKLHAFPHLLNTGHTYRIVQTGSAQLCAPHVAHEQCAGTIPDSQSMVLPELSCATNEAVNRLLQFGSDFFYQSNASGNVEIKATSNRK